MKFVEEVRKLSESFEQLKSDLAITKNVNSQLHNCFVNIEKQCWVVQYSRRGMCRDCGYTHVSPG